MVKHSLQYSQEDIRTKIKWLMGLRVFIVTLFLGTSLLLHLGFGQNLQSIHSFFFLMGSVYLLTLFYALFLNQIKTEFLTIFASAQICIDLILETVLIFITGGIESPFSFLYLISVFSSGMIMSRREGIGAAAIAAILYGGLIDLQFYGIYPTVLSNNLEGKETFYILFLNIMAFVLVGYVSGGVSEQLRKTGEALRSKDQGLTELKGYHEHIVQSMSSGLFTTNLRGVLTSFNRAAEDITGYTWGEIKGRPCWEILDMEPLKEVYALPQNITLPYRFDRECHRKEGTSLLLGVTVSSLKSEGVDTGVIGIFQDLTQIHEMEGEIKRKEQLAHIGEMAAGMAHEIRNPLASLSGSMQVLSQEPLLNEEAKQLMEIALRETDRLEMIISAFLEYARPSPPVLKKCDLIHLLHESIFLFKQAPEFRKNVEVFLEKDYKELIVTIDPDQMKQVFWNLFMNSVQAMPKGGTLRIKIGMAGGPSPGNKGKGKPEFFQVFFQDSGDGINPENFEKIFYPFFTTKDKGSGLGLAIVHRIIEEHRGVINVESRERRGTTFILSLPYGDESMQDQSSFSRKEVPGAVLAEAAYSSSEAPTIRVDTPSKGSKKGRFQAVLRVKSEDRA